MPSAPLFEADPDDDRLALLIYTSGSTGTPKGAMYTDRTDQHDVARALPGGHRPAHHRHQLHAHEPLRGARDADRDSRKWRHQLLRGQSDLSTLFEDIALVRPTELLLVPRICDMLFQRYQSELDRG